MTVSLGLRKGKSSQLLFYCLFDLLNVLVQRRHKSFSGARIMD